MNIRPATIADIPVLRRLAEEIWRACYPGIIPLEQIDFMLGWMYSEAQIQTEIEQGYAWELIEEQGTAIGFIATHLEPDGRVKLNKLYVLPAWQGKGVGARALNHVMERAEALGARAVWMQVNKNNTRAIAAYRKAGFHVAQEAVFEIGHGFVMDDYLMEKAVIGD
jgi:diamine N-acetyltransferase